MPELPEVEVVCRGIEPHLVKKRITSVMIRNPSLRWPIPNNLKKILAGLEICKVTRRGKYLLFDCGIGTLILHLGMSGTLLILPNNVPPQKHDHFELILENGLILRLNDPRRFGAVLWTTNDVMCHPLLMHIGPDPFSATFCKNFLYEKTRGRKTSIKEILMKGHIVSGIGNIYASEALFHAGINPRIAAGRISMDRYDKLVCAVKKTLKCAISAGGSSLRNFVNSDSKPGYFQQKYWVYKRNGKACRKCGSIIKQIKQGQRSSFYCKNCQK